MNIPEKERSPALNPSASLRSRAVVLVVDDHPANLAALDSLLGDLGFELVLASSGHEALLRLAERSVRYHAFLNHWALDIVRRDLHSLTSRTPFDRALPKC